MSTRPRPVATKCAPAMLAVPTPRSSDAALARLMTEDGPGEAAPRAIPFELRADAVAITTGAWSDNALKLFRPEELQRSRFAARFAWSTIARPISPPTA